MLTSLRGSFYGWLSRDSGFISTREKHSWNFQLRQKTWTTSSKALFCFSRPSTSYPYSFFNPSLFILRSSPRSCLLLSSARFHLPCLHRQLRTLHCVPWQIKTFYFKTRRKQLCGSCHFASPYYFFCRGLMLVNARQGRRLQVSAIFPPHWQLRFGSWWQPYAVPSCQLPPLRFLPPMPAEECEQNLCLLFG